MSDKKIIPCLYLKNKKAVTDFSGTAVLEDGDIIRMAKEYGNQGADKLLVFDLAQNDAEWEEGIGILREICQEAEIPVLGSGLVKRMEDVKKILYAGCEKAVVGMQGENREALLEEVSKKFGKEQIIVAVDDPETYRKQKELFELYAGSLLLVNGDLSWKKEEEELPVIFHNDTMGEEEITRLFSGEQAAAVTGRYISTPGLDLMGAKRKWKEQGIATNTFESSLSWKEFKLNSDGMIPVIAQDYKTNEVLMMAYMNEQAFQTTLETGKMTYWSRSRNELWTKGMTSGHFQYVKSLTIDCDNDTILAKVSQVGAACHTGNRTCFFKELVKKPYDDTNPLSVFQDVYDVIQDRKLHPREGSYTNYLFDKGIDKILKKVGEECTEIVIAAKNPDPVELVYEISDFLYHVMVLMAERGLKWEDITKELARR